MATFEEFRAIELRTAEVKFAERVSGSDKLLKLSILLENEKRQLVAGVGRAYAPEELIGKEIVVVANLEPRTLMGVESQSMLLAATDDDGMPVLLTTERRVGSGKRIS